MVEKEIAEEQKKLFEKLIQLNVNDRTEKKNDLTYLSWAWAWQEFKKICPDATYEIKKFPDENGREFPYVWDEKFGIMVFTSVTAGGITYEMWLPVMDGANRAMKSEPYSYFVKKRDGEYVEKEVASATMFDINKTIMRCLVKNIAMFGLGLYIYAGEDLPEEVKESATDEQIAEIRSLGVNEPNVCKRFKISSINELTATQAEFVIATKKKASESKGE